VVLGVFPNLLFHVMDPSIELLVNNMDSAYRALPDAAAVVETTMVP